MIKLSIDMLTAMKPCYLKSRTAMFGKHKDMNVKQAFSAGFTVSDIIWVAGKLGSVCIPGIVEFANGCAESAAVRYAADSAARTAVDAAAACRAAAYAYVADSDDAYATATATATAATAAAACRAAAAEDAEDAELERQKQHLIRIFSSTAIIT